MPFTHEDPLLEEGLPVLKNQRNEQKDFGTPGEIFAKTRGGNALFPVYFFQYRNSELITHKLQIDGKHL
ncbi:hypothetical protein ACT3CE_00350 [Marinifilum sp. RC60d5]|uniref:hypothetical protein n=1 Tax=Marinifilum sp. RC60d5 TaxID=3458414 RepID=UPI0040368785